MNVIEITNDDLNIIEHSKEDIEGYQVINVTFDIRDEIKEIIEPLQYKNCNILLNIKYVSKTNLMDVYFEIKNGKKDRIISYFPNSIERNIIKAKLKTL